MPAGPPARVPGMWDACDCIHNAIAVTDVEVHVDPDTLDRIFVVHSEEQEPLALRISPIELQAILKTLAVTVAKSLN